MHSFVHFFIKTSILLVFCCIAVHFPITLCYLSSSSHRLSYFSLLFIMFNFMYYSHFIISHIISHVMISVFLRILPCFFLFCFHTIWFYFLIIPLLHFALFLCHTKNHVIMLLSLIFVISWHITIFHGLSAHFIYYFFSFPVIFFFFISWNRSYSQL